MCGQEKNQNKEMENIKRTNVNCQGEKYNIGNLKVTGWAYKI